MAEELSRYLREWIGYFGNVKRNQCWQSRARGIPKQDTSKTVAALKSRDTAVRCTGSIHPSRPKSSPKLFKPIRSIRDLKERAVAVTDHRFAYAFICQIFSDKA